MPARVPAVRPALELPLLHRPTYVKVFSSVTRSCSLACLNDRPHLLFVPQRPSAVVSTGVPGAALISACILTS